MTEASPVQTGTDRGMWYRCRVTRAGVHHDGAVAMRLKEVNGAFEKAFLAPQTVRKDVLAVALTAVSTGLPVDVYFESIADWSEVRLFYVGQG